MLNILSRLPPKSLTRFKCVSEVWLALIRNPDFFSKNLLNHSIFATTKSPGPPDPAFILFKAAQKSNIGNETFSFLSYHTLCCVSQSTLNLLEATPINLPPELPYHRLDIVASSSFHGLLCLHDIFVKMNIYLWNPFIPSKLNPLPYVPPNSLLNVSPYTVGAGFDPRSNDFKVVKVFRVLYYSLSPTTYKVDVYSVRSGSWRQLHADLDNMLDNIHYHKGTTVYVNE